MKENKIMGIIWLLIAIILTLFLIWKIKNSINGNRFKIINGFKSAPFFESKTFDAAEINKIDIYLISENILVEKSQENKITVEIYSSKEVAPKVQVIENKLKIESFKNKVSFSLTPLATQRVVIKLPSIASINNFDINNTSGSIQIIDIEIDNIDVNCNSGSINMKNSTFVKANAKTTSGAVHIDSCKIVDLEAKSTSGNVRTSGRFDKLKLNTVSGSIYADSKKALTQDSEFKAVSGAIYLKIPENSAFNSSYNCISGKYKNKITGTIAKQGNEVVNGGGAKFEFQSTSGSIQIN